MKINFYFSAMEEARELEGILNAVAKQHFNPYDYSFTTCADAGIIVTGYTQIHLKSEAYLTDLDKARDSARKLIRGDDWQDINLVTPPNLSETDKTLYLVKQINDGEVSVITGARLAMDMASGCFIQYWKNYESKEMPFMDFCEDVLENLSFVPKVFIE